MKDLRSLLVSGAGVVGLSCCIGLEVIAEQHTDSISEHIGRFVKADQLNNVVKVRAGNSNGYGLIVGRNDENLVIVTARHIFSEEFLNGDMKAAEEVKVRLYGIEGYWNVSPGRTYQPVYQDRQSGGQTEMDITAIEVRVPRTPGFAGERHLLADAWREDVMVVDPEVGTPVELTATVNDIGYAGGEGRIAEIHDGRTISFANLIGQPGQSGAPVSTGRGFVGLYLGSGPKGVISLLDVQEAMVREFGAPLWALTAVEPRATRREVCVSVSGTATEYISVSGPNGIVDLDERGCGPTSTGRHVVAGKHIGLLCEPNGFQVLASVQGTYAIACKTDPSGLWTSPVGGFLTLQPDGRDVWRLTVTLPAIQGLVEGVVTGSLPTLFIQQARLGGNIPVTGWLRIDGTNLHMHFYAGTRPIQGAYER